MKKTDVIYKIRNEYPKFIIKSINFLGNGYDSDAYIINEEYVFKFPKHPKAANNLYKEAYVLLEIRDQLPVKVPKVEFIGKSSEANSVSFVGYEKIEGFALTKDIIDSLDEDIKDNLAREIACFFKALHKINLKTTIDRIEIDKKEKCIYEYNIIKEYAYPYLDEHIKDQIDNLYEQLIATDFNYKKSLVHNDFGASNIFFDTTTNKISGIIDFGDVAIYDQDIDFICLLQNHEEGLDRNFVLKVLDYYEHNNINSVIEKSSFNEFYSQLEYIVLGKEFVMEDLFQESIEVIKKEIKDYNKNIIEKKKYVHYI